MTYNEFKLCCYIVALKYNGKQIDDILDYDHYNKHTISLKTAIFERSLDRVYFSNDDAKYHFFYEFLTKSLNYLSISNLYKPFYNVEEFLNHFKIPLEDVV